MSKNIFKMNTMRLLIGIVLTLAMLTVVASPAAADTTLPDSFYGTITIGGSDASVGTVITAKISGVEKGSYTTIESGRYGNSDFNAGDVLKVEGSEDDIGETIEFWVGGTQANETSPFSGEGESKERNLTFAVTPPAITGWSNDKTNSDTTSITVNESESVRFNATADQIIDTWNWFKDGANQSNNFDNYTTSWSVNGTYTVSVNATNINGTSDTKTWTITVNDTTPPVISDVANSTPTSSSVTITWTTDEASDSIVKYGNTSGSYTANVSNTTKVTLHSIALSGLDSNMAYYFVVNSTDASGNSNESSEYNFTTATEDVTAPVISDVANSTPTSSSVTITWTTDEASDSIVKYGNTSGSYTANVSNTTKVTLHSIALSGLDSNMAYYFVVNSTDASGNSNESSEYNFTTATEDVTAPVISDVANSTPTSSSVTITWTTDEASDSIVKYGNTSGSYTANVSNTTKVTLHSIALSGLDSNMAYYFVVNSTDASGNSNESSEYNFTTATEDVTAPVISDVANSTPTSSSVTITWTTDEASDSIVKYGNTSGSYTANVSNTTKVTLHSIALSGLDSNMAYYFVVNSTDASGNSNESSEYNFTTVESTVNISITLIGGWNLIAIPVYPLNATVASVFADVNMFGKSVYKYGSGGYEVVTTVEPKVGYWVFSVGSPTIWIEGTPVTS